MQPRDPAGIARAVTAVREHFREHPEKAVGLDAAARARLVEGLRVDVEGPHGWSVATDMSKSIGGTASAPSPGWLLRSSDRLVRRGPDRHPGGRGGRSADAARDGGDVRIRRPWHPRRRRRHARAPSSPAPGATRHGRRPTRQRRRKSGGPRTSTLTGVRGAGPCRSRGGQRRGWPPDPGEPSQRVNGGSFGLSPPTRPSPSGVRMSRPRCWARAARTCSGCQRRGARDPRVTLAPTARHPGR